MKKVLQITLIISIAIDIILYIYYGNLFVEENYIGMIIYHIFFILSIDLIITLLLVFIKRVFHYKKYNYLLKNMGIHILMIFIIIVGTGLIVYGFSQMSVDHFNKLFLILIGTGISLASLFLMYFIFYIIPIHYYRVYKNSKILFDSKTFNYLGFNYAKDINNYYYNGKIIFNKINMKSLKVIGDSYATDKENIFYKDHIINGVVIESFKIIKGDYSTDLKNILYKNSIIENIDIDSFEYLGKNFCKDKDNLYIKGQKFFLNDISILNAGDNGLLYKYQGEICYTNENYKQGLHLIGKNIEYIGGMYIRMNESVYEINGQLLTKIESTNNKVVKYIKDNHILIGSKIYNGVTYIKKTNSNLTILKKYISYDKKYIYWYSKKIEIIGKIDFSNIDYGFIKNGILNYYEGEVIKDIIMLGGTYFSKNGIISTNKKSLK